MIRFSLLADALVEVCYPERCSLCSCGNNQPWADPGPVVPGLRIWDRPHLCRTCFEGLQEPAVMRWISAGPGASWPVWGGRWDGHDLVTLVGTWKYQGVRGLAWPLADLAKPAAVEMLQHVGPAVCLVPVPLHRKRRWMRGFNQAAVLADLLALALDLTVRTDLIHRTRQTRQQAQITDHTRRQLNTQTAFQARFGGQDPPPSIVLVDDLVTSGATTLAAAEALAAAGHNVAGILAIGLARLQVDTPADPL